MDFKEYLLVNKFNSAQIEMNEHNLDKDMLIESKESDKFKKKYTKVLDALIKVAQDKKNKKSETFFKGLKDDLDKTGFLSKGQRFSIWKSAVSWKKLLGTAILTLLGITLTAATGGLAAGGIAAAGMAKTAVGVGVGTAAVAAAQATNTIKKTDDTKDSVKKAMKAKKSKKTKIK